MKFNIIHTARLANLPLTDKEIKQFEPQLEATLSYIDQLNEIDTENIYPTSQVTGLENILREDEPQASLPQQKVLSNKKGTYKNYFRVKGIFENE